MALSAYARGATDRIVVPVGKGLVRLGFTANGLTLAGLLLTLGGVGVVALVDPFWGAVVMAVGAALDAFDGTVARLRGRSGPLGSFYDSVADRVSDTAMLGVMAWLVRDDGVLFALAGAALALAVVTSYMRAKAESLGWDAAVGLVERPERMIVILLGVGLGFVPLALVLLVAGGLVTVAQRFRHVVAQGRAA